MFSLPKRGQLTCWIAVHSSNKLTLIAPYLPTGVDPWSPLHCFSLYTVEDLWAKPWAAIPRRTDLKNIYKDLFSTGLLHVCRCRRLCNEKRVCIWSYFSIHKGKKCTNVFQVLELNSYFTATFNNTWTLKFKAQTTNAFFATISQLFGDSSRLSTTAEHCFVDWTVLNDLITARS